MKALDGLKVERGCGRPIWRQIGDDLRGRVLNGTFGPGDRLPTEQEMSSRLGVNRHTVRRAVAALVEQGLLRVEQGRGTFVQEHVLDYPIGRRTRFTEAVARVNRSRGRRILDTSDIKADVAIAKALGVPVGHPVAHLRGVIEVDDRPVGLGNTYLSRRRFPDLARHAVETRSITAALARCGLDDYFRKTTKVATRMPTRDEANILRQPQSRPVLVSEAIDVDRDDRPISFGVTLWAGDRVQFVFES